MEGFVWCHHCAGPHPLDARFCPHTGKSMAAGLPAARSEPELIGRGTIIDGRYCVQGLIGRGGQSIVYEAMHTSLGHSVAIKFLAKVTDRKALSRFEQEARLAASLVHPNVCRSYDMGQMQSGTRYIVMERLHGESLFATMSRERVAAGFAVHIIKQVLAALAAAHAARVIHRDIKPGNVFVERVPGMEPNARVLDFGFAKVLDRESGVRTTIGRPVGTPAYMSPEQLNGAVVDGRTDIFSVGVVLYEMFTGVRPFQGDTAAELMASVVRDVPPPLTRVRPDLPASIDMIVQRAMAKKPASRFASADDFQRALEGVRTLQRPPTTPIRLPLPNISGSEDDEVSR
jgi:serine/threonine-protein kinase